MAHPVVDQMSQVMDKHIQSLKADLAKLRTGRASTTLLDPVHVDYYGSSVPVQQVANLTTPDARTSRSPLGSRERSVQSRRRFTALISASPRRMMERSSGFHCRR
jgi:hypothetical protein